MRRNAKQPPGGLPQSKLGIREGARRTPTLTQEEATAYTELSKGEGSQYKHTKLDWRVVQRRNYRCEYACTGARRNNVIMHFWPPAPRTGFPVGAADDLGESFRVTLASYPTFAEIKPAANYLSEETQRGSLSVGGSILVPSWDSKEDPQPPMATFGVTLAGFCDIPGWERVLLKDVVEQFDNRLEVRHGDAGGEEVREGSGSGGDDQGERDPVRVRRERRRG